MHAHAGKRTNDVGQMSDRVIDLEQQVLDLHKEIKRLEALVRQMARTPVGVISNTRIPRGTS